MSINYFDSVSVPVRCRKTKKIVFLVQVYGVTKDTLMLYLGYGGESPGKQAIRNCGMDEKDFYVSMDDVVSVVSGPGKDKWQRAACRSRSSYGGR